MKKFLNILLMASIALAILTSDGLVNSINKNELTVSPDQRYFNQLSKKYYGTTAFGNYLALINQSVLGRDQLTRHDIIVPSRDALVVLHKTCNIAELNQKPEDRQNDGPMALLINQISIRVPPENSEVRIEID